MALVKFVCPCLFGLEGPLADELRRLGAADVSPDNGRVSFSGELSDLAGYNISLRLAERVLIELGSFGAATFDELFEGVKALPLEDYIPLEGAYPVKGHSIGSALHSIPDCQRIIKKAASSRLSAKYGVEWLPETGETYQLQFSIMNDTARIYLDTTGQGLHKRGYRPEGGDAPLRETLAAAMVNLSRYRGKGDFCDPFCGSGTIAIEAAMIAKNKAPGLLRGFAAESWRSLEKSVWREARDKARSREYSGEYSIYGGDVDPRMIRLAEENARRAGVADIVKLEVSDARSFSRATERGLIVTNPPYGERLMEKREAEELYRRFGEAVLPLSGYGMYILSSHTEFERTFGGRADKKRKLYNGMIKCELFIYNSKSGSEKRA